MVCTWFVRVLVRRHRVALNGSVHIIPILHQFEQHSQHLTVFFMEEHTYEARLQSSHKRKYGKKIGSIHTPKAVTYHEPTAM